MEFYIVSIHVPLAEHDRLRSPSGGGEGVSIHVPLAEHDLRPQAGGAGTKVSIHVPLAEHDAVYMMAGYLLLMFQFTCPSRSTTGLLKDTTADPPVSIHVPLAEHDRQGSGFWRSSRSFNSRAPRGARPPHVGHFSTSLKFQFTCPSRSTTVADRDVADDVVGFQFTCPSRSTTGGCRESRPVKGFQFTCPSRSTT